MDATIQKTLIVILVSLSVLFTLAGVLTPFFSGIRRYFVSKSLEPTFYAYKLMFIYLFFAVSSFSLFIIVQTPEDLLSAIATSGCLAGIWLFMVITTLLKFENVYGKGTMKRILKSRRHDTQK